MKSFSEWLAVREDSAFGRARKAAAQGLGPTIPDAEINSRNTAPAWQKDAIVKRNKKKKRRKKKVGSPKPQPVVHHDLDTWLQSVDNLKKDLERLKGKLFSPDRDDSKVVTKPAKPVDKSKKNDLDKKSKKDDLDKKDLDKKAKVRPEEEHDDMPQEEPEKKRPFKKPVKQKPFVPLKKDFKEPEE